jgi:serralysin
MKSKFITDAQDPSDGFFNPDGDVSFASFSLPWVRDGGASLDSGPVAIPSIPPLVSEAVESSGAQSGTTTTTSLTSGGITINLLFDAAAMAAPPSFRAGIQQAASILTSAISDKITVNIKIDYSGTGGGAAAGPDNGLYESYSSVRTDLVNNETPGDTTFNALPGGSSVQGQSSVAVWNAQLKLFGLMGASDTTTDDGSATFATDINSGLLVGVALHELTHAMGRVPYGSPYSSSPDIFDLYRFTSPGTRLINGGNTAPAAYFSLDGGNTKLADFGQNSDPSDFLNSGVQGGNDPFNEYYTGSTLQTLTTVDKQLLDALGFHTLTPVTTVIEAFGSTSLVEVGSNYFLDSIATGTGPELKYGGAPVVAGQFGSFTPVGVEQTSGGYELAWQIPGTEQFSIWNTDSSGNFQSFTVLSGNSTALESLETSFHQDLNGDGVIGIPVATSSMIESLGSTSLVEVGNNYYMYANNTQIGPELKFAGAAVTAGQFGSYAPVGAELLSGGGYEVAWQLSGAEQFSIWNTDSSGNYTSYAVYSGSSPVLQSLESSFHQDLNGDGVIGLPAGTTVIEAFGSTSLVKVGSNYYLESNSSGAGPELSFGGAAVTAGQFGSYTPVGTEQTSGGYEVAWQIPGTQQFSIWNTDSSGNYTSYTVYSGSSPVLQSLESSFHQDLNGDGAIGLPTGTTVIEAFGSTSLVEVGSNYYLESNSSGAGPELGFGGAAVTAGQFGSYTPVGTEQTSGGYEVAWQIPGTQQFSIWNTDSSGNFQSYTALSGTSTALESLETSFHQDLNGDGVIGVPAAAASQVAPVSVANNDTFLFRPGFGADVIMNAGSAETIELDGFSSVTNNAQLAMLLNEAQTGQSQALFLSTNGGHDTVIDLGNHDSITLTNVQIANLHANNFIVI